MSEQNKPPVENFYSMTEAAVHEGIPVATRLDNVSENSKDSIVRTPTTFDEEDAAALRAHVHNTAVKEMYPDPITLPPASLHQKLMDATREAITGAGHLSLKVNLEDPQSIEQSLVLARERHPELSPVAQRFAAQAEGDSGAASFSDGIAMFAKQAGRISAVDLEAYSENHPIPQMSFDTSASFETDYLALLEHILDNGWTKTDRTGTGTKSLFGNLIRIDMRDGRLPLLTTKKVFYRTFLVETLWFLSGSTNIEFLKKNNVHIWDDWVIPESAEWHRLDAANGSHRDAITRLRCSFPTLWKEWKKYCESNEIGQPTHTQLMQWVEGIGMDPTIRIDIFSHQLVGGSIGPGAYGTQWRNWDDVRIVKPGEKAEMQRRGYKTCAQSTANPQISIMERTIDQIANAIALLKSNPDSRRIIVSAWNPGRLEDAALSPCHSFFQFFSRAKTVDELRVAIGKAGIGMSEQDLINGNVPEKILLQIAEQNKVPMRNLSLMLIARSQDFTVGSAFNIPQYVVLANLIASVTGHDTEEFVWVGGDTHVYQDQVKLAREQLTRKPNEATARLVIRNKRKDIDQYELDDLLVEGYDNFHPHIPYPVAV